MPIAQSGQCQCNGEWHVMAKQCIQVLKSITASASIDMTHVTVRSTQTQYRKGVKLSCVWSDSVTQCTYSSYSIQCPVYSEQWLVVKCKVTNLNCVRRKTHRGRGNLGLCLYLSEPLDMFTPQVKGC